MPDTAPPSVLLYGSDNPLPERVQLRAGPLTLDFEAGDLRYIRNGDTELIRRIYVAVRDRNWDTIAASISSLIINQRPDSFDISFDVTHRLRDVHFVWRGEIAGDQSGRITYSMNGRAVSTFLRNRIGICVLHPGSAAGRPALVGHVDGTSTRSAFPREISPHQPFYEIKSLAHEAAPGIAVRTDFEGETFEMEDQRNWTDGSFKTYSTPLRLKFPVEISAETAVRHKVTLTPLDSIDGAPLASNAPFLRAVEPAAQLPEVAIGRERFALPGIGVQVSGQSATLTSQDVARLRALRLDHLRAAADLTRPGWQADVLRVHDQARGLGASVQLDLVVNDDAATQLEALASLFASHPGLLPEWRTLFVHHASEKATATRWVELAREKLGRAAPRSRVGGGTRHYFTELNRNRPAPPLPPWATWSVNPQVHAFDNSSLVETLAVQAETVRSSRAFLGEAARLAVGPITLRPRSNPNATSAPTATAGDDLPPEVDPRQMSLFAAAWTLGSIRYLAEAGAATATYFETSGRRGLMATMDDKPHRAFHAAPGSAYPVYHLLALIGAMKPGGGADGAASATLAVHETHGSHPLIAEALALEDGSGRTRTLVANLTPAKQRIRVTGLAGAAGQRRTAGAGLSSTAATFLALDASNCQDAAAQPETFLSQAGDTVHIRGGALEITLAPYALTRVDQRA